MYAGFVPTVSRMLLHWEPEPKVSCVFCGTPVNRDAAVLPSGKRVCPICNLRAIQGGKPFNVRVARVQLLG